MTTATIDPRSAKALEIVATAATWPTGRTSDGRPFYAVPSQREAGLFHMTDGRECSCQDFQRRGIACKHARAVAAWEAGGAPQGAAAPPVRRVCSRQGCDWTVRPESIYSTCDECSYTHGGER